MRQAVAWLMLLALLLTGVSLAEEEAPAPSGDWPELDEEGFLTEGEFVYEGPEELSYKNKPGDLIGSATYYYKDELLHRQEFRLDTELKLSISKFAEKYKKQIILLAAAVVLFVLLVKVLAAPIRLIFKLAVNAALGFLILFVVNFFGDFVGIGVTVNLFTALIAGVLSVPGVVLLVLLQFLF